MIHRFRLITLSLVLVGAGVWGCCHERTAAPDPDLAAIDETAPEPTPCPDDCARRVIGDDGCWRGLGEEGDVMERCQ